MPADPLFDRLIAQAKDHYKDRDFKKAQEEFLQIVQKDKNQWECELYLAMCDYKLGNIQQSAQRFRSIADLCPDREIREKARVAMGPVNKEALSMTMSNLKKPEVSQYAKATQSLVDDDDDEDISWSPKENRNFT